MQIISGKFRARKLIGVDSEGTRPTLARVKESIFNIIQFKVAGSVVLDLFAGSGALGIESLSRGAKEVQFNDFSKDSVAIVKKNLNTLKIAVGGEVKVTQGDYLACLEQTKGSFDLIFIDPPYRMDYGKKALEIIAKKNLLTDSGVAVYERDCAFEGEIDGLEKYDERKYGKAYLTFFRKK